MTEAALGWQVLIFASIAVAGRWRWWVIAFWSVWTIVQIATLPLSVLQFGTIAASAALFLPKRSRPTSVDRSLPKRERVSCPVPPPERGLFGVVETINKAAIELNGRSAKRLEKVRLEHEFRRAAAHKIKTEDFTCAIEEQVMKEALARDLELTREIDAAIQKDPVLEDLYRRQLEEYAHKFGADNAVQARQIRSSAALKAARQHRELFALLLSKEPAYRQQFYSAYKDAARYLDCDSSSPRYAQEDALLVLGRHIDEWIADLESIAISQNRCPSALQANDLVRVATGPSPTSKGEPFVPAAPAAPTSTEPNVAFVTRHTFFRLSREWLRPLDDVSLAAIFTKIYERDLSFVLNRPEAMMLYVQKHLLEGRASNLRLDKRAFTRNYVFSVSPPKFHVNADCEYLKADFSNYRVPAEVSALGPDKVRAFQKFCEENKKLIREWAPDAFWAHVSAHFRMQIQPQPVQYANSGLPEAADMDVVALRARIEGIVDQSQALLAAGGDSSAVKERRYAPRVARALVGVEDPVVREALEALFDLKRRLLDSLFELYKRVNAVGALTLPVELLQAAGLDPCKGCWPLENSQIARSQGRVELN